LLDPMKNLYVANCLSCYYTDPPRPDSISVYAPGRSSPQRIIKEGIQDPRALAVDSKGRLFVANAPLSQHGESEPGWVSVYAAGSTKPSLTITDGIDVPLSLAVDPSDNLYVANNFAETVTVYS